ncbi:MAG: RnfABCDGE type electron transport complex subunit D [Muribaculaceae bacterium]|nr:RnfABCDGE type electron transport complex subunit D [Muribaculaceae bacterium]
MQQLIISGSPHVHTSDTVNRRMWNVVIALLPAIAVGIWVFGLSSLTCLLISVGACLLTEWVIATLIMKRPFTLLNGSALITGILLAMNVPASLPWWMVIIGAIVAIGIGKMSFGGLGTNIWNPALVGRVFLLLSFPAAMTTWSTTVGNGVAGADASSGATILGTLKMSGHHIDSSTIDWLAVSVGDMNGSWGEVGSIAILIGLAYLLITRTITWHIPVSMLLSAAILAWVCGANPIVELLTGGMLLGAVFMATDYVTSPMTHKGQIIYGVLIGVITIVIRLWGAYPEGVSFAILLGNSCTPLLNKYCRPRRFGSGKKRKEAAA